MPSGRRLYKRYLGWIFVIPGLALYTVVVLGPSIATARYAFFDWSGLGKPQWVGFQNFVNIVLHDWVFRIGLAFVIYYGALRQIDVQLYEAARIEGAGVWQLFIKVSLPLLRPTIVFLYLLQIIWSFMAFDYVYIMTKGGPGHASELATTWIYDQAFIQFEAGYACALAIYLTLICAVFVGLYLYFKHLGWESF